MAEASGAQAVATSPRVLLDVQARVGHLALELALSTVGPLVIIGPNGAGKTSLLSLILGLLPARRGRIEIARETLLDTERHIDVPIEQRRIGYVPQDYALFPHLTVRGNVAFAVDSAAPRLSKTERRVRVQRAIEELGLGEIADQSITTLSGGEKQRTALARALSIEPRALLLDEPLAALDVRSRHEVRNFLGEYLGQLSLPTLVVTHDAVDARQLADRILVLENGHVTQVGSWTELAARPASKFVEEFVGSK
jgi:molybdate transport system ATP-binding protein